jgi:hypothetical protein
MEYSNPDKVEHTDATATLGFERATDNTVQVWANDCPHCLQPFNRPGVKSWSIKVYTNNGIENWCEECAEEGIKSGICIKYRSLDKKERKMLNKYVKQQTRQAEGT